MEKLDLQAKKIKRLEIDLEEVTDIIHILNLKIINEKNSRDINQNKITSYNQRIRDQEYQRNYIEEQIAKVSIL